MRFLAMIIAILAPCHAANILVEPVIKPKKVIKARITAYWAHPRQDEWTSRYESSTGKEGVSDYKDFVSPNDLYKSLQGLKGKFMLSYNDSANIRKIFGKYNVRKIKTKYAGVGQEGGLRNKTELIITNY